MCQQTGYIPTTNEAYQALKAALTAALKALLPALTLRSAR